MLARLRLRLAVLLALALPLGALALASPAFAISVSPLVIDMSATGKAARASLNVYNDGKSPLPVEIRVLRLDLDLDGKAKQTQADDDFVVFPPQAIVRPGATQVFRLQWVGDPALESSRSYTFSVNQLPVKLARAQSGVQVVFNFGVTVNVAPLSASPRLEAVRAEAAAGPKGARRPVLVIENKGERHAYLSDASLTLSAGAWSRTISSAELKQYIGLGLVQPGKKRRFSLPVDLPPEAVNLEARVMLPKQPRR
jgi:P pilus assembly chaperone PapD